MRLKIRVQNLYMVSPWMLPCSLPWNIYDLERSHDQYRSKSRPSVTQGRPCLVTMIPVRERANPLTVPSSNFKSACWTPSPDTSRLMFKLSACRRKHKPNLSCSYRFQEVSLSCAYWPSSLSYQLHRYILFPAVLLARWTQRPTSHNGLRLANVLRLLSTTE